MRQYFSRKKGKDREALPAGEMNQLVREAIVKSEFLRDVALKKRDRIQLSDELCKLLYAISSAGTHPTSALMRI